MSDHTSEHLDRGFPEAEYRARVKGAQRLMADHDLTALLLTTEPGVRYFSGFLTRFWESPTRPWFLVVPIEGKPIAVIPTIGEPLMARTWLDDIRTWPSPQDDDLGVEHLADTLHACATNGRVGLPMGAGNNLRIPLRSFHALQARAAPLSFHDDAGILDRLRLVKSTAEVAKIEASCEIANRAFARVPEIASAGTPLDQVFRAFQALCLEEGADGVSYLAGACEPGGYTDVISPATNTPVGDGDVLMLDTGVVRDGYFCDFNRNFAIRSASNVAMAGHGALIDATAAAATCARPGATMADLYWAMDTVLNRAPLCAGTAGGRLGHSLGMELTEGPSILPGDHTPLQPGMVLTLEPAIDLGGGRLMVHEENIVIESDGPRALSATWPANLQIIET